MTDAQIPVDLADRQRFKVIAAEKGKSMKALFHEWLEKMDEKIRKNLHE